MSKHTKAKAPFVRTHGLPGEIEVRSGGQVIGWVSGSPSDLLGMWSYTPKGISGGGGCWSKADAIRALRRVIRETIAKAEEG